MNTDFLEEKNWPKLDGRASDTSKQLHEWCSKISQLVLRLSDRITQLESKESEKKNEISKLRSDFEASKKIVNSPSISNDWVQVIKHGTKAKKPADQMAVANATISEMNERERRRKNIIIHGVPESKKEILTDKRAEDESNIKKILNTIGKSEIAPVYSRRLKSKDTNKPGPILVEFEDAAIRNPILLAAKKLREVEEYKTVYISPDLTETERALDYELRRQRNEANSKLEANSPFRYGIRGNQIIRFKKLQ